MLEQLFTKGYIWQARRAQHSSTGLDTGFAALNLILKEQGWPSSGAIEILHDTAGIGEMSLLLPHLIRLSQQQHWQLWINPPYLPNAAALEQAGMDLDYMLLVNTKTPQEILWATEEAIKSPLTATVISWPQQPVSQQLRRLHLCAAQFKTPCFIFRKIDTQHSACALKLQLQAVDHEHLQINVIKQHQAKAGQNIQLHLPRASLFRYPRQELGPDL